ncbi:MAG TPA: 50S ribosomal protein L30 [Ignisphaera aggregans]|uniref:Large ribosomal subunit protein uL30 n=1 Tax=Ignisphaera aggregans TaxID=334771 RepID=A0A832YSG4_9CREN|nr:50S ribosomal protein L30 [Ignisphaera aggregans]
MVALYAIIRIRGIPDTPYDIEYTLRLLRLVRKFHCVLYPDTPSIRGMLFKVKDWVTWGEIDRETLIELLRNRGRVVGNKPLTDEYVKRKLKLSSIEELADMLLEGKLLFHKLESYGIKPVFRLHPPRGGFKGSTKKPYGAGGELGYRGPAINELIRRMI